MFGFNYKLTIFMWSIFVGVTVQVISISKSYKFMNVWKSSFTFLSKFIFFQKVNKPHRIIPKSKLFFILNSNEKNNIGWLN